MKKRMLVLGMILIFTLVFSACRWESPIEDFEYEFRDGEAIITDYKGSDFHVVIPAKIEGRTVTTIGESAFEGYDLKTVDFPDSLTRIEKAAFSDCDLLERVEFPEGLEFIGYYSFYDCDLITEITLPDNVEFEMGFSYTYPSGGYYRIWSPVRYDVIINVSEGSQTLERLRKNEEVINRYFSDMESFAVNYAIVD